MTPPTIWRRYLFWMNKTMRQDNEIERFPVRKNPRLGNYDYSCHNYYFVTICTQDKLCLFGSLGKLSLVGVIAEECLRDVPGHFSGVTIDKWVVMPNHVHIIVILPGDGVNLSTVIGQYKAAVTKAARIVRPDIQIWQASFHDHIIRNQADYERIWTYIDVNPARWMDDCFYIPQAEP